MSLLFVLPLRVLTGNRREHWSERSNRTRIQRGVARMSLSRPLVAVRARLMRLGNLQREVLHVVLERCGPGPALDTGNLWQALKAVQDGVQDALCSCSCVRCRQGKHAQCRSEICLDDGDPRVRWEVAQSASPEFAVRIEIRTL